jgi:hypothetical protein
MELSAAERHSRQRHREPSLEIRLLRPRIRVIAPARDTKDMATALHSFSVPDGVESLLGRVRAYWQSLQRGESNMPFSDDVDPSRVPELEDQMMLIGTFENPDRFRFEIVGAQIVRHYGGPLAGRFTDEIEPRAPLDSLTQQCVATVAQREPTYFRAETAGLKTGYARLLLPTWGEGHVMLLVGAIARL